MVAVFISAFVGTLLCAATCRSVELCVSIGRNVYHGQKDKQHEKTLLLNAVSGQKLHRVPLGFETELKLFRQSVLTILEVLHLIDSKEQ